jgi:hypothetical protein
MSWTAIKMNNDWKRMRSQVLTRTRKTGYADNKI